jgi:glycosyltransferase involved in cell wall biosynthesis
MNPTRIAYICADPGVPVFGRKGCSIHVQEVIRALCRHGAQVQLFATCFGGVSPGDLSDVPTHRLPCPDGRKLAERERACQDANADLRHLLDAAGPFDVVYERYSLWSFSGISYASANGVPGLLEVNALLIEEQAAHRGLVDRTAAERIAQRVFGQASALVAVSDEVAAYLRTMGANPRAIHVIPNGVDALRFPAELAPAWHWPEGEPAFTVGFVGTLKPWHGVPVLLEAFARFQARAPDARLLLVGDGPEREALAARVRKLGLEAVCHFTGAVEAEKIPGLLVAMDIAVAPYPPLDRFYFSPLKVYEYMAAGRAVIASRIGQLVRLIRHGENGLLCEPGDTEELARQLARLHGDAGLRARLGAAARQTILGGHTWRHVAGRILALAESCRHTSLPSAALKSGSHQSPAKQSVRPIQV